MTIAVGVDAARLGARKGWIAVTLEDVRLRAIRFHDTFAALLDHAAEADAIGVDIPIGHDDPAGELRGGRRAADEAARDLVGPRRASVFLVPPLDLFATDDHADAVAAARARGVIAPSAQSWGLRERLLEANAAANDARVHEVHPEVSFQALHEAQGGTGHLEAHKRSWNGLVERLELLHAVGLRPRRSFGGVGRASPDDVLDATVVAWSAHRVATGAALCVPDPAPRDPATGRQVRIQA